MQTDLWKFYVNSRIFDFLTPLFKNQTLAHAQKRDSVPLSVHYWERLRSIFIGWGQEPSFKKRLARGYPGINRLDKIAKQHDIDYSRAKNLQDKWKSDTKTIAAINKLPGKKTMTKRIARKIMQFKKHLKL